MANELDVKTIGAALNLTRAIPGTAAQRAEAAQAAAEAAQAAAEQAASTVTSATVAETKEYLGIT